MNIKSIATAALACFVGFSMMAVPARKGIRVVSQPDGSTISLRLTGDEHFHTLTTADGFSVGRGADGFFYYRNAEGLSTVKAHDASLRADAEHKFLEANAETLTPAAVALPRKEAIEARKAPRRAGASRASQVPQTGSPKVPILLVQYSDIKFKDADPKATFENFFNYNDKSAFNYFKDQSNGKYTPDFQIFGPVTLSGKRATYGANDIWGNDQGVGKMVAEACQKLNSEVDFSKFDNDGDGECDVIIVLYAGDGEASSYDDDAENSVWPCQWDLGNSDYGQNLNLDGTLLSRFAVFNELNGSDLRKIDGIGTFCHEFSHCLDLPDFYDTDYSGNFGMANWSLMDYGSYNDDGYTPIGYSAYEKAFMGWINLQEAKENTLYTLPVFNQKNAATDIAVKVTNDADPDEYYVLENRAKQGWDAFLPTEGLMISHVTFDQGRWDNNTVNTTTEEDERNGISIQHMTLKPADGVLKMNKKYYYGSTYYEVDEQSLLGDLWPYKGVCDLTDESLPAATVNTGSYMHKPITDITRNADGTISFWAMRTPNPPVATPVLADHKIESTSSVTVNWLPVEETAVSYTLEIRPYSEIKYELIYSADFSNDNHGWISDGYTSVDANENATRLGSNKQLGSLTTPAFRTDETGEITVFFNAKQYGTDGASAKVSVVDAAGKDLVSQLVELSTSYGDYCVKLTCNPSQSVAVSIATTAGKKRFYLRSASVYTGDATSLEKAPARAAASMVFNNITATSHTVKDLEENGVYEYRVKAVPVDLDSFNESPFTDFTLVDLSAYNSAVSEIEADSSAAPAEYFNLQGIRVAADKLVPGIYIRHSGGVASKVIVR